jgi:hypothetical protein
LQAGTTTIVKGTRQMGKSSLLARAYGSSQNLAQKAFYLDFQLIDNEFLESLETLFRYLALKLAKTFKLEVSPTDFWEPSLGAKENLTEYLQEAILSQCKMLMLLDEADLIFNYAYRDQFFATIRVWHNLRATRAIWNNLNIIIAHSTEPYLWIQDIHQSPFNVGRQLNLEDFDVGQLSDLNERYGRPLTSENDIMSIMSLLGGHPYLIRQALFSLVDNQLSVSQLERTAIDDTGPFSDHLRRYSWSLRNSERLKTVIRRILLHNTCEDETDFQKLKAAGLVKGRTRRDLQLRCQLYDRYFRKHL